MSTAKKFASIPIGLFHFCNGRYTAETKILCHFVAGYFLLKYQLFTENDSK